MRKTLDFPLKLDVQSFQNNYLKSNSVLMPQIRGISAVCVNRIIAMNILERSPFSFIQANEKWRPLHLISLLSKSAGIEEVV